MPAYCTSIIYDIIVCINKYLNKIIRLLFPTHKLSLNEGRVRDTVLLLAFLQIDITDGRRHSSSRFRSLRAVPEIIPRGQRFFKLFCPEGGCIGLINSSQIQSPDA